MFLVPSFGVNWMKGANTSFGVAMYGSGGMNSNYLSPAFGFAPTGVNLSQLFVAPTVARKFAGQHSIGLTAIVSYQMFKAEGLKAFSQFSRDASKLTDNKTDSSMGIGAKVGYTGQWSKYFAAGTFYQTRIKMSKLDKYSGLFAGQGGFDIPPAWSGGVAISPNGKVTFTADGGRIFYSQVKSIGNPMLPNLMKARLGDEGGAGFGWQDISIARFGVQIRPNQLWTLRGGFSAAGQPIPESEMLFNILAPGVEKHHASLGFSRVLGGGKEFHFALERAFSASVTGPNRLEALGRQNIRLRMDQWEAEIGFTFGKR
ncbi:MAG: outer membrane protein transport protein [Acidobacteria bacterium]|nr:outer membrane protein transport protein [Acidobacteriota bacterium]